MAEAAGLGAAAPGGAAPGGGESAAGEPQAAEPEAAEPGGAESAAGEPEAAAPGGAEPGRVDPRDVETVTAQLGRQARGVVAVAHRCPCGSPDVVRTSPRLPDGTPFPTSYYLTCPRATGAVSTLESQGMMREMSERLLADAELAASYRRAHERYLAERAELGEVPEIAGTSAGGMPERVKCLHVLVAHSLAAGPGVNPLGDEAVAALGEWWAPGPCVGGFAATARTGD